MLLTQLSFAQKQGEFRFGLKGVANLGWVAGTNKAINSDGAAVGFGYGVTQFNGDIRQYDHYPAYQKLVEFSELKTAFEIGFLIFLPFLVIDIVIASILMSLGMMMLSPMLISLPFKLLLFVLVDGWAMTIGSLSSTFVVG